MNETYESPLLAHAEKTLPPINETPNNQLHGDLYILLSSNKLSSSTISTSKDNTSPKYNDAIDINGIKYRRVNTLYCYSRNIAKTRGGLVDRRASGGLSVDHVRIMRNISRTKNV